MRWVLDPFLDSVTMQHALAAGTLAAIACGLVGTWVVLRGMTFIGDALAHGVLPGLALATIVGFSPTIGAFLSAGVMVGGISLVGRRARLNEDAAIGLIFVGMLALGVLIVSHSRSFAGDLTGFLFGFRMGKVAIFQTDEAAERRISEHAPVFQFLLVKACKIVVGGCLDNVILGLIGL